MKTKWSHHLYSYLNKQDSVNWNVSVTINNEELYVNTSERILKAIEVADNKIAHVFSGEYVVKKIHLNIIDGKIITIDKKVSSSINRKTTKIISPDSKHYYFDEFDVFMSAKWTMSCRNVKTDEIIWNRNIRHWLYTEVEHKSGILYFSTQGNGGLFYALSLVTGEILFSYSNSAVEYYWIKDNILICDKNQYWILIDKQNGFVIDKCPVPGDLLYVNDNYIYLLHKKYNRSNRTYEANLCCIEL